MYSRKDDYDFLDEKPLVRVKDKKQAKTRKAPKEHKERKKISSITWGYILCAISFFGYLVIITNFFKILKTTFLGLFGIFSFAIFFILNYVGLALIRNKKYTFGIKKTILVLLSLYVVVVIFHLAFGGGLSYEVSFGKHISQIWNDKLTVGGIFASLLSYPLMAISHSSFATFSILFILLVVLLAFLLNAFNILDKIHFEKREHKQKKKHNDYNAKILNMVNESFLEDEELFPVEKSQTKSNMNWNKTIEVDNTPLGMKQTNNVQYVKPKLDLNTKNVSFVRPNSEIRTITNTNGFIQATGYSEEDLKKKEEERERNRKFVFGTMGGKPVKKGVTMEDAYRQTHTKPETKDNNYNDLPLGNLLNEIKNGINNYNPNYNDKINLDFNEAEEKEEKNNINLDEFKEPQNDREEDFDDIQQFSDVNENQEEIVEEDEQDDSSKEEKQYEKEIKEYHQEAYEYHIPPTDLLNYMQVSEDYSDEEMQEKGRAIEAVLESFKIPAKVTNYIHGPAVTRYELDMPIGISVTKVIQYANDIKAAVRSRFDIRIEAPIPGKDAVGIEVPNDKISPVSLREMIESEEFQSSTKPLAFTLGRTISGEARICNLADMPHLLIAGSTGSGKSVCLNALLLSILYHASPEDVRVILIDPKQVEFSKYEGIPHLLVGDIICNAEDALSALTYGVEEMERRYTILKNSQCSKISEYNSLPEVVSGRKEKLPYLVIVVDEVNDLISNNKKDFEDKIGRIAQKARAAGIHLVLATQRPSVDVIGGTIKNNLTSRIAFRLMSFADSKTVLDQSGAEKLLGRGDMLYAPQDLPEPIRIQGAYVGNSEIKDVVNYVKENNECEFDDRIHSKIFDPKTNSSDNYGDLDIDYDPLVLHALKFFINMKKASVSVLQRNFRIGYNKASRIVEFLEREGHISAGEGSKVRDVYTTMEEFYERFGDV